LRLLDARVPEHQLDDADVDPVRQQPTGALMPQVMPAEIDPLDLLGIPLRPVPDGRARLDPMGEQSQGFPGRLELRLVGAVADPNT
jgi:hypothetical protein